MHLDAENANTSGTDDNIYWPSLCSCNITLGI